MLKFLYFHAEVAELADALRSGRSSLYGSVGSTPTFGTSKTRSTLPGFLILAQGYILIYFSNNIFDYSCWVLQG